MVYVVEDELQGVVFGVDDQVDVGQVFFKFFLQLVIQYEQKGDKAYVQFEEDEVEEYIQWFIGQVFLVQF